MKWVCVVGALAVAACAAAPGRPAPATRARLAEPERLSGVARSLVRERMARHGEQMTWLVLSTVLLDYSLAEETAHDVVAEPRLAKPTAWGGDTVNAALPARFLALDDEMARRAQVVLTAARASDHEGLRRAVGGLTETCVACHASYLHDEAGGREP